MSALEDSHVSVDPNDPIHQKICYVCTQEAKPGQEHIRNYGGIVCFSCRAFFRRSHQKTKNPDFSCSFGGNCKVTVKNRRRCQKCRYDRCLAVGMSPALVLTETQKHYRFRKLLMKKRLEASEGQLNGIEKKPVHKKRGRPPKKRIEAPSGPGKENEDAELDLLFDSILEIEDCNVLLAEINESFEIALQEAQTPEILKLFEQLWSFHTTGVLFKVTKEDLQSIVTFFHKVLQNFCYSFSKFQGLKTEDQKRILTKSTPLFFQMLMAAYFGSSCGEDQVDFFLNVSTHSNFAEKLISNGLGSCYFMSLSYFNEVTELCYSESDIDLFSHLIQGVRGNFLPNANQVGISTYVILFHEEQSFQEEMKFMMETLFPSRCVAAKALVDDFLSTLSIMAACNSFFDTLWSSVKDSPVMQYTKEEDVWLMHQVKLVNDAFKSVPYGEENVQEIAMFSLGVPLSKGYLLSMFALGKERIWRMLNAQEDFFNLPENKKLQHYTTQWIFFQAIMMVSFQATSNGLEQLFLACTSLEQQLWREKFSPVIPDHKVRKLTLADMLPDIRDLLPDNERTEFFSLFSELVLYLRDDFLCRIMYLLFLCDASDIKPLRRRYKKLEIVLSRCFSSKMTDSKVDIPSVKYCYERFKKFAMIVGSLYSAMQRGYQQK